MTYNTPEEVDERIKLLGGHERHKPEHDALVQIREMLSMRDSQILQIEETLEKFRPVQRALNYWLCGADVKKWAGVTREMLEVLEARVESLKPPDSEAT